MNSLGKLILELREKGFSRDDIKNQLKCSSYTVSKYLDYKINDKGLEIQRLRKDNKSIKEICKITGYSKSTISKWCSKLDNNDDIIKTKNIDIHEENKSNKRLKKIKHKSLQDSKLNNRAIRNKQIRINRKEFLLKVWDNKCSICGYDKSQNSLHFHHMGDKLFSLSGNNLHRKLKDVIEEAQKCILVCGNCHCEIHDGTLKINVKPKDFNFELPDNINDRLPIELSDEILKREKEWIDNKIKSNRILKDRDNIELDVNKVILELSHSSNINKILNEYHYLGSSYKGAIFNILFKHNDIIVGAAIVTNPVRSSGLDDICEISRFVLTVNCDNLASKCLSLLIKFVKNHGKYKRIQAFAEEETHLGTIYKAANFRELGKRFKTYNYDGIHKKTIYEHAQSLGLTEHEYAEIFNLNRFFENGKIKFIYKL